MNAARRHPSIVLMGVAGSGKSSVAPGLAAHADAAWFDADDLHTDAARRAMAAGITLTDAMRAPWLDAIAARIAREPGPVVVACSALRRTYRDRLRRGAGTPLVFLHLDGSPELIAARLRARSAHFATERLLPSQLSTLEPLDDDESGAVIPIDGDPHDVLRRAVAALEAAVSGVQDVDSSCAGPTAPVTTRIGASGADAPPGADVRDDMDAASAHRTAPFAPPFEGGRRPTP